MVIVYADDEPLARRLVCRTLQERGHTVFSLDTGQAGQLQTDTLQLLKLSQIGLNIDILVMDGHNLVSDEQGRQVADMTPLGLIHWLNQNGLAGQCHYILFSNDTELVRQAQTHTNPKFAAAICKTGDEGGLQSLIAAIEQIESNPTPSQASLGNR